MSETGPLYRRDFGNRPTAVIGIAVLLGVVLTLGIGFLLGPVGAAIGAAAGVGAIAIGAAAYFKATKVLSVYPGRVVHATTRGETTYDPADLTLEVRSGNAFVLTPKGQLRKSFCVFTDQDGAAVRAAFTAAGVAIEEPAGSEAHRIGRTDWRESDTLR
ncbi:MAG TPA: hypothetical protein VL856_08940 [Acidimicrobiia bacterium]|jgi:hypothetical protein|nr:hypothetical protein [Acidimicrobiia bacterium]